ncbi:MAG: hypothetical protein ACRD5L_09060 [Bryobacteraceae bacterium]
MSAINSISSVKAAYEQQSPPPPKPPQSQPGQDSVQLSKAALTALTSGDADHDGDRR